MSALNRKLLRDLIRLWAQGLAIALVMASGVATLVLSVGTFRSLEETQSAYYERYRFGDIFAGAVRAPASLERAIGAIDGVAAVETRIARSVILDVEGLREPASALVNSLPASGDVAVNALYIREGRLPLPSRANEVVISSLFADAHGFGVGSSFAALLNGSRVDLQIVGVVLSPEYIYAMGPGSVMPDNRRFGVLWMSQPTLAALFDLEGAFNNVSLRLLRDADPAAVIADLDALLKPYGGTGAIERKDQMSHAFLDGELRQLDGMSKVMPPVFLLVSAFLINMILSRLISLEREQIGLLKALGYGRTAVAWHYLKLVLMIAAIGVILGAVVGTWAGRGLTILYSEFFSFPFLLFRSSPDLYLLAAGVSMLAASVGALRSIGSAFALPAAVAMRPPTPMAYREVFGGAMRRLRIFSQLTNMAIRHLARHPVRSGMTAIGVAFSVALPSLGLGTIDSVEAMMDAVYFQADRQDASLSFAATRGAPALRDVENLPGVMRAEPFLSVPVKLTNEHYSRQLAITGKEARTDLSRVLDMDLAPVILPDKGLAVGDRVAEILRLRVGDVVSIEMLDGNRRVVEAPVTQIIQSYLGLMVFMEIEALSRLTGTGPRMSGAHVSIDDNQLDELFRAVKATPVLGGIELQSVAADLFRETMRENIAIMVSVYMTLAVIIAFGVIYNSARIQLSERARELATLRVLGFRRFEVSNVLFIEIGVIVAVAQPIGWAIGAGFGYLVVESLATDLFRMPFAFGIDTLGIASFVVIGASLFSALIVRRRVDRLDLIQVLKTRE